jgi:hypothetical protein
MIKNIYIKQVKYILLEIILILIILLLDQIEVNLFLINSINNVDKLGSKHNWVMKFYSKSI